MPDRQRRRAEACPTDPVPTAPQSMARSIRTRLRAVAPCLAVVVIIVLACASAATAAPSCPASTTLTPGSQDSPPSAVLYCGGTYSDTWDAKDETDWIAFYTTQASATVVAHYVSTETAGSLGHGVNAYLFNPGYSTESPEELSYGEPSWGNLEPRGLSYTFSTPGLHYVKMIPEAFSEGTGYQLSLTGEWSQTPPQPEPPASVPSSSPSSAKESKPAPAPMPCVVPPLGRDVRAKVIKERISEAHCAVGRISYVHRQRVAKGIVVALNPRSGTHLAHGAKVSVLVSSGPDQRGHRHRRTDGRHRRNSHASHHGKTINHCPAVYDINPPAPTISFSGITARDISCDKVRSLILRYISDRLPARAGQWHCVYQLRENGPNSGRCTKDRAYFRFTEEQE